MQRPQRQSACPECARAIHGRAARFCGWCGAPVSDVTDRNDEAGRAASDRDGEPRPVLPVAIVLLVAAGAVAVLQSAGLVGRSSGARSHDVDLTDEVTGAPLEATGEVSEERLDELRARAAGSRLRCEPRGCERWRLTLGEEWARIGTNDGHVLFLRDRRFGAGGDASTDPSGPATELLVVDVRTGDELVRRELAIPAAPRGSRPGSFAAAVTPGGIALALDGRIVSLDLEGVIRWQQPLTDEPIWYLRAHGDRLFVFAGDLSFRATRSDAVPTPWEAGRMYVLDGGSGALLWSAPGDLTGTLDDEVAVLTTSVGEAFMTGAHELDDGRVRWERATDDVVRTTPQRSHVVLTSGHEGVSYILIDAHTGAEILALEGALVTTMDRADGRSYLLIDRAVRDDEAREPVVHGGDSDLVVLALDADGRPLWRTEVEAAPTGYARLATSDDLLILIGERGAVAGFDLTSGEEQVVEPDLTGTTDAPVWTDADGRSIRPTADGVRIDSEAGWVRVHAEHGAWLIADDPLLVTDGTAVLAVDPVPG